MEKKNAAGKKGIEMEELKKLEVVIEEDGVSKGSNESFQMAKKRHGFGSGFHAIAFILGSHRIPVVKHCCHWSIKRVIGKFEKWNETNHAKIGG
jgi:hypothetical protein